MRTIGNILVWVFIALGFIAATSFYAWPVGTDAGADDRFVVETTDTGEPVYAELLRAVTTEAGAEVVPADTPLTPETLETIRDAGAKRVIVKHQGSLLVMLENWTGKWLFLISAAGLVAGAIALRTAARREIEAADAGTSRTASAEDIAARIRAAIADLRASLPALETSDAKEAAIIAALGEVQAELVPAFVDTRPVLIGKRGMGGFAAVMDKFAAMERSINRAWSAAADSHLPEALASLDAAARAAEEFTATLGLDKPA